MAAGVPPKYMGSVMFGSGVCAIFCNILRAVTLLAFPTNDPATKSKNEWLSALVFFFVAATIMLLNAMIQLFYLR